MKKLKQLLSALFLGANLCSLLALWLCCLSTWLEPARFPLCSLMGLAFPITLCINIGFFIFWLIFRVRYIWVPLVGMLLVGSYIYDYCPIQLRASEPDSAALTVLSFNTGDMIEDEEHASFYEYVRRMKPDILCMQEFQQGWFQRKGVKELLKEMNYNYVSDKFANCIITRLPILGDTLHVAYPTRHNRSIACWVEWQGDSVLVVSNHLESNQLNDEDKKQYRDMLKEPHRQTVKEGSKHLFGKLSEAVIYRGAQADVLCSLADSLAGHHIIMAGDFNDTPISYTYQQLARRLNSVYRESGNGFGRSFSQRGFPVRIDHLFISRDLVSTHTFIDKDFDISDHYPLVTHLSRRPQNDGK